MEISYTWTSSPPKGTKGPRGRRRRTTAWTAASCHLFASCDPHPPPPPQSLDSAPPPGHRKLCSRRGWAGGARAAILGAGGSRRYGARAGPEDRGSRARPAAREEAESERSRVRSAAGRWTSLGSLPTRHPMARASRSGGLLPPLANGPPPWAHPAGFAEARSERPQLRGRSGLRADGGTPRLDAPPGGAARRPSWGAAVAVGDAWEAGGPMPAALQRLRAVLLRLHREREQLLQARECARQLQAAVRLLRPGSPARGPSRSPLSGDVPLPPSRGTVPPNRLPDGPEPLLVARPLGLAAQHLDASLEMQLRALGRAPASLGLTSQLAELLQMLPAYHRLRGHAAGRVPRAARPFPAARVLRLLAVERGCQVAERLAQALGGPGLQDRLRGLCAEERELLPGLLGLLGDAAGADSGGLGLAGAGILRNQYWTLLWTACAQNLDLILGPWRDPKSVAQQLSQAVGLASLPRNCEEELAALCLGLLHQSLVWNWDQGFCQALGSASGDQSSPASPSRTADRLQRLFPPLLDALREPRAGLTLCQPPGPSPVTLGLCTLQATLLWFLGRAQQHLAAWAPGSFVVLVQKDLPHVLQEVEALSSLTSEGGTVLEGERQLGLQIRKLTAQMQLLPEESLDLFFQECYKQATQGLTLLMPRGRYWKLRLCPELPSAPSDYAGLVVRTVLEPVLQGLQGMTPQAQAPALGQALTATLGAWLDHILSHGIRFSLQGARQLRRDFGVVGELLEEERWGLSPELRRTLLRLSIFQRLEGALVCLLQQPLPRRPARRRPSCCCVGNDAELPTSSLNNLDSLAPPLRPGAPRAQMPHLLNAPGGGGPSPEAYLAGNQQAWLALRLRQPPRWHAPFLSCLGTSPEP